MARLTASCTAGAIPSKSISECVANPTSHANATRFNLPAQLARCPGVSLLESSTPFSRSTKEGSSGRITAAAVTGPAALKEDL